MHYFRINQCWPYSHHGSNGICMKVVQDDNPHLHQISTQLLQICWLRKAAVKNDKIGTLSHPTYTCSPLSPKWKRLYAVSRTGWDLCILHLGWHRNQLTVLDGNSPVIWEVGLHTVSSGVNGILPANGCDLFWHWLHLARECFKIAQVIWKPRIPLTSHANGKNVNTYMPWNTHDNISRCSGEYPCKHRKWAATRMCKMPGSSIPASSRQSEADRHGVLMLTSQTVPSRENVLLLFQSEGKPPQKKICLYIVLRESGSINLKSLRKCSYRGHFLKLTWNWLEIVNTGVEKLFRKFHAGIASGSKDITILIMHSVFCSRVYIATYQGLYEHIRISRMKTMKCVFRYI